MIIHIPLSPKSGPFSSLSKQTARLLFFARPLSLCITLHILRLSADRGALPIRLPRGRPRTGRSALLAVRRKRWKELVVFRILHERVHDRIDSVLTTC